MLVLTQNQGLCFANLTGLAKWWIFDPKRGTKQAHIENTGKILLSNKTELSSKKNNHWSKLPLDLPG